MKFERETKVRDLYARDIGEVRPGERVVGKECRYGESGMRVDLRTVDTSNLIREWEFKIYATYEALGQIQVYVYQALCANPGQQVRGVIAAFDFQLELRQTVRSLNLNIELVTIPHWMAQAGGVPLTSTTVNIVKIPKGI
ncbi:hypothetical protein D7X74_38540 [Corallococcus sp. CA047B]|uniref:hypothetical protein n=1 Tax=Corallococcus sp. CA047B TaxID=2316729 RepID=UPI000EA04412|nr:hypothetical protein [Corallococcus sp. CA047B]RKH00487.1 hypothetical protein D7X74_38540 [Corallococcus sp. CA047B]